LTPPSVVYRDNTFDESGGNLLGRWTHKGANDSEFMLQMYIDRYYRAYPIDPVAQNTFDIEFQHTFKPSHDQRFTWGGGYRLVNDSIQSTSVVAVDPAHRNAQQGNLYGQDDIALVPDRLHLFLGSKFEVNSYSGFEVEPGARMLWTVSEHQSAWASVSRAVRTHSRADEDATAIFGATPTQTLPAFLSATGNVGLEAEELTAYELGYRCEPFKQLSIDIATFFNHYDDLITYTAGDPPTFSPAPIPHLVIPLRSHNALSGETYGVEASATAKITEDFRIATSYSLFQAAIHRQDESAAAQEQVFEGSAPHNQFQIRAYYDLTRKVELNAAAYYVDNLSALGVPGYWRLDAGVTWHPTKDLDLSVGVQNALDNNHPEWSNGVDLDQITQAPRTVYAQATFRF